MNQYEANKWDSAIKDENYNKILKATESFVDNKSENEPFSDYFTPHDKNHCEAVLKLVKALLEKGEITLSDIEKFILYMCVWTHDLGMYTSVAMKILNNNYSTEYKRTNHEKISAAFMSSDGTFINLFMKGEIDENLARSYINTINIVNKYHRRKYDITNCPKERYIKGNRINSRLLAALVRLGDTLHVDTTRYDRERYDILQIGNFDRTARLHWLKSYVVSSVYLDIKKQTIYITLDLPDPEEAKSADLEENAERLKTIIYDDIVEDVLAVQDVFRENDIPFYSLVKVDIHFCTGIEKFMREEIVGIINDLHIVISPSTSKVIKKSIDSIKSLARMQFDSYEKFYRQTDLLIQHLNRILEDRPCHVGLRRTIKAIEPLFAKLEKPKDSINVDQISKTQKLLRDAVSKIETKRKKSIVGIVNKAKNDLKNITNILLFGVSEIVSKVLNENSNDFKQNTNIYIFECGGKRQLSPTNNIEYNDCISYATIISNLGFKNVNVLPDTSFASLIEDPKRNIEKENTVLLLGANGIEEKKYHCGHSSGHLMMVIVARHYKIPVIVVSDSYKLGKMEWKPDLERKGESWLTGQKADLSELKERNINLINYREDKIPAELIDKIIFENESIELGRKSNKRRRTESGV